MAKLKVASNLLNSPANSGPGKFARLLSKHLDDLGIRICPSRSVLDSADAYLANAFMDENLINHCKRNHIPIILRVDGVGEIFPYDNYNNDYLRVKYSHANADHVIYQSNFSKNYVQSKTNFVPNNNSVILNGVELRPVNNSMRDEMHFISICNNWTQFRYINFYHAIFNNLTSIVNEFPNFRWTIVGKYQDFKNATGFSSMCHPSIAEKHIEWVGFCDDLSTLRKHAYGVIHIVGKDSCPNSLIESMSYGLPAIVWHESGGPEIAGKAGCILHNTKAEEILQALRHIDKNYYSMVELAYNRVTHKMNIEFVAQQYAKVICKRVYK